MSDTFIEKIKPFCVALLIMVGVSVGMLVFSRSVPDGIIVLNSVGDTIPEVAAVATGALCCPGVICIFWKSIRMYVLIALAFVLLLFLSAVCFNAAFESISYQYSKNDEPVERTAVILMSDNDSKLVFEFLDNEEVGIVDSESTLSYFEPMEKGDTCVAYYLNGILGIDFVTDMYVKKRARH